MSSANAQIGLYGKHPTYREFLRLNASSPCVRALDQWLSAALPAAQRLISDWDRAYVSAPAVSFLLPHQGRCLLGVLTPSADSSGRQFPLVLFAEMDARLMQDSYPLAPFLRQRSDMERLAARCLRINHERLLAAAGELKLPDVRSFEIAEQEAARHFKRATCGSTFEIMFGGSQDHDQARVALDTLQAFGRALLPDQPLPSYGLRCPLGGFPIGDVAFWLQALQHGVSIQFVPRLVWTQNTLLIYFTKLDTKALTVLWRIGWFDDSLADLATTRGPAGARPDGGPGSAAIDPELTLGALLDAQRRAP